MTGRDVAEPAVLELRYILTLRGPAELVGDRGLGDGEGAAEVACESGLGRRVALVGVFVDRLAVVVVELGEGWQATIAEVTP